MEQQRVAEILDAADRCIEVEEHAFAKIQKMHMGTLADLMTRGTSNMSSSWGRVTCGEAFSLASGLPYMQAIPGGGSVPIYGSSGLAGHGKKSLTLRPTIVIGRVGEGGVGSSYYLSQASWITDNALWANWISPGWLPEFIAKYLTWFDLRRIRSQTGQPLVTQHVIAECPIVKPSLDEQREIVDVLRGWQAREMSIERNLAKVRTLKQGLMDDLLSGRVRVPSI